MSSSTSNTRRRTRPIKSAVRRSAPAIGSSHPPRGQERSTHRRQRGAAAPDRGRAVGQHRLQIVLVCDVGPLGPVPGCRAPITNTSAAAPGFGSPTAGQFRTTAHRCPTIVKGVKRAMAGSTAVSCRRRCSPGQCRLIELGFRQRRASGLRPAARADRPVRFGEGAFRVVSTRAYRPTA